MRTAKEWEKLGVKVIYDPGDLPLESRETTVSFIRSMPDAEIDTAEITWQKRLESDGAKPYHVTTYAKSDADYRSYTVPKSWVKMPYRNKPSGVKKELSPEHLAKMIAGRQAALVAQGESGISSVPNR